MSEFWLPFAAMMVGAGATYVWRALGVALSGRVNPDSRAFEWIACVAYALLAALIARMIIFPIGPLAETYLADRLGAAVGALAIFFLTRNNLLAGVSVGTAALVALTWGRTIF
ncbi:AzlD domain-containing protein [Pelagibius sp. Alg239-R121]|uniref:AzlD domain-containing protein n=1 Tax=Pelagibius sp. Alg239-R121 TaxID=2993448 RepID=UPI0024A71AD2|nr:AzlD domain-containing protein [Pelagibius sp. Alg239-R121]